MFEFMKKEIKDKWVDALRSGDYVQGRGQLRNPKNEFCCLGVLCNLHAIENPDFAATQINETTYGGQGLVLPKIVEDWAGMPYDHDHKEVVEMNDGTNRHHCTFEEIADYIEENY